MRTTVLFIFGWTLVCTFVCTRPLPVSAQTAPGGNAEPAIRALEHAWFEGQARNDNRALNQIFDNALVYIENGRSMTKGEYLTEVRSSGPSLQQVVLGPMTVHMFGNTAIVVGSYGEKSVKDGKTWLKRWRFVDTWVQKNTGWMLVAAASAPFSD